MHPHLPGPLLGIGSSHASQRAEIKMHRAPILGTQVAESGSIARRLAPGSEDLPMRCDAESRLNLGFHVPYAL